MIHAELSEAMDALGGKRPAAAALPPGTPRTPAAGEPAFGLQPHLLRLPAVHDLALSVHYAGMEASRRPQDFGLELAARLGEQPAEMLALLQQACSVYRMASEMLEGRAPSAGLLLYNWAVALSDCARIVRPQQPDEARELLGAAAAKYGASLEASPFSHQALNNLGLVLTDLAALRPPGERAAYAAHAVAKFRRAARLRPDFERAVYNLGTVAYAQACAAQEELLAAAERGGGGGSGGAAHAAAERAVKAAFAHAAQYIALAYALQPDKPGGPYRDSLAAVQRLLPLPHLRAGPLRCVAPETAGGPDERWTAAWFALDAGGLRAARPPVADSTAAAVAGGSGSPMAAAAAAVAPPTITWRLQDITSVRTICDPSLPAGHAFWLGLAGSPAGAYLIAAEAEEAEGWVDALSLLLHLSEQRRLEGLQRALAVPLGRAAAS